MPGTRIPNPEGERVAAALAALTIEQIRLLVKEMEADMHKPAPLRLV
jgi:hypothetical protein